MRNGTLSVAGHFSRLHRFRPRPRTTRTPMRNQLQSLFFAYHLFFMLTSHVFQWGCGCIRNQLRSIRTRCTCLRRGHGDAYALGNGCIPSHKTTIHTTRNASRLLDVRACEWDYGCNRNHNSKNHNVGISYSFNTLLIDAIIPQFDAFAQSERQRIHLFQRALADGTKAGSSARSPK